MTSLLFAYAIYASCCGKKCAKLTLGFLFLAYTIALVFLVIGISVGKESMISTVSGFWIDALWKSQSTYAIWRMPLCAVAGI